MSRASVVSHLFVTEEGPRDFGFWQDENRSDTGRYREDFQRRQTAKDPGRL
jgi:hypothetical protein